MAPAHLARTLRRRAQREVVASTNGEPMDPTVRICLNRLSAWPFTLARAENAVADVQWRPRTEGIQPGGREPQRWFLPTKKDPLRGPFSWVVEKKV